MAATATLLMMSILDVLPRVVFRWDRGLGGTFMWSLDADYVGTRRTCWMRCIAPRWEGRNKEGSQDEIQVPQAEGVRENSCRPFGDSLSLPTPPGHLRAGLSHAAASRLDFGGVCSTVLHKSGLTHSL